MIFQIAFNRDCLGNNEDLKNLGAVNVKNRGFNYFEIEIKNLEDLQELDKKIYRNHKGNYSMIIGFDDYPTIFIDDV